MDINLPLKRIDVKISLEELFNRVAEAFDLGTVKSYSAMEKGLNDADFKLITDKAIRFVKVFSDKTRKTIDSARDIVNLFQIWHKKGIPVPKLYPSKNGEYLVEIKPKEGRSGYACVMEFFEGEDLSEREASDAELRAISQNLAKINSLKIKIHKDYDSWFVLNLPSEYKDCFNYIDRKYKPSILKIVEELKAVDLSKLRTGLLHGDIQREHILCKGKEICIIDPMPCFGPVLADLAIAMSNFCLDVSGFSKDNFVRKYKIMLKEYMKYVRLTNYEQSILPLFIKASYASYYCNASRPYEDYIEPHNEFWIAFGKRGLDLVGDLDF